MKDAGVVKLVTTADLKSAGEILAGSSPAIRTIIHFIYHTHKKITLHKTVFFAYNPYK